MLQRLFLQIIGIFSIFTATDCNRLQQTATVAGHSRLAASLNEPLHTENCQTVKQIALNVAPLDSMNFPIWNQI